MDRALRVELLVVLSPICIIRNIGGSLASFSSKPQMRRESSLLLDATQSKPPCFHQQSWGCWRSLCNSQVWLLRENVASTTWQAKLLVMCTFSTNWIPKLSKWNIQSSMSFRHSLPWLLSWTWSGQSLTGDWGGSWCNRASGEVCCQNYCGVIMVLAFSKVFIFQ